MVRKASSLLELVVAIVIMGIAVMTLPTILLQSQNNDEYTLQQEVILAAKTKLGDILTYRWDEHSLINNKIYVLVTNGDSELNISTPGSLRRVGHIARNKRRKFSSDLNTSTPIANLGPDGGDLDDVDDFNNTTTTLSGAAADFDYHFTDFNLTTKIDYFSDNAIYSSQNLSFTFGKVASATTSNIKMLTLNITSNNNIPFTVRSYSCNIGESELLRKVY